MKVRTLLTLIAEHGDNGRTLDDDIVVKVGGVHYEIDSGYVNGTLILIAGPPIR